jgi:hypothetical protein
MKTDGIKEYWYQPDGQGGLQLVEKQADNGGSTQLAVSITYAANKAYTQVAAKTTAGNLQIFNPADLE